MHRQAGRGRHSGPDGVSTQMGVSVLQRVLAQVAAGWQTGPLGVTMQEVLEGQRTFALGLGSGSGMRGRVRVGLGIVSWYGGSGGRGWRGWEGRTR